MCWSVSSGYLGHLLLRGCWYRSLCSVCARLQMEPAPRKPLQLFPGLLFSGRSFRNFHFLITINTPFALGAWVYRATLEWRIGLGEKRAGHGPPSEHSSFRN